MNRKAPSPLPMFIKIKQNNCHIENENHYTGYGPVRTVKGKIFYIKGAPRLYGVSTITGVRHDEVIENRDNNTKSAYIINELMKCEDISNWGNFLAGNYLIAVHDPEKLNCYIITDLGNSYPLFQSFSSDRMEIIFCNDIDLLALNTQKRDKLDYVSIVDYLTQKSITYPYTFYKEVYEVDYASCIKCCYKDEEIDFSKHQYWLASCYENEVCDDIKELSIELRQGILSATETILSDKKNIGAFLSGGKDSRVIAGLMNIFGVDCLGLTFADALNRETEFATKVVKANGLRHEILIRDLEHYPRLIEDAIALQGPHFNFTWMMFLGYRNLINSYEFDALIGGYMSDTLLKLHEANVKAKYFLGRHCGTLETFDQTEYRYLRGGSEYLKQFSSIIHNELLEEVRERRKKNLEYWMNLRTDGSAWEWSYMWPFMRNKHNANLTTHIFHYQSFEIFTERPCIEVSRIAPQRLKINGRLFNKATFPFIKKSLHIPFSDSMFRYSRHTIWNEFSIAIKHVLPARWTYKKTHDLNAVNPIATERAWPDLTKLWDCSSVLQNLKERYGVSQIERKIMNQGERFVLDPSFYGDLSNGAMYHIMYTLLYLDIWQKKMSSTNVHENLLAKTN